MQGAADSAAYSAATAMGTGQSNDGYTSEAKSVAGTYGYVDGRDGVTITISNPPTTGNHTTDNNAVEVTIKRPQPLMLASLFLLAPPTISASAVARTGSSGCVLALDRGNVTDMTDNGNTVLNLNNCNLYVNSPSSRALVLNGSAQINANAAFISGDYTMGGHASLNTTAGTHTGVAPANDPYSDLQIPGYQGCDQTNFSLTGGQSKTFTAGSSGVMVFCNGLSLTGGSQVTLNPGTYIIDRGSFSLTGNSSISVNGVTIILTSSTGQDYATVSISGGLDGEHQRAELGRDAGRRLLPGPQRADERLRQLHRRRHAEHHRSNIFPQPELDLLGRHLDRRRGGLHPAGRPDLYL